MATSPIDSASPPPMRSPELASNPTMMPAPQPSQLISASKIQRIDVWRTEVEITDLVCVCSLSTAPSCLAGPSRPLMLATRSTSIYSPPGSMPFSSTISAQSHHAQQSPASSIYSSSEAYASTQATSPLSSNSLGLMLDGKLGLCPQCGVRKADRSSHDSEREQGIPPANAETNGAGRNAHETSRKKQLWLGVKKLARKCTGKDSSSLQPAVVTAATPVAADAKTQDLERDTLGRVVSCSLSRLSVHGFTTPTPPGNLPTPSRDPGYDRLQESPTPGVAPEASRPPNVRKRAGQAFKRISVHLGAPLQFSHPPDYSASLVSPPPQKTANRPSVEGERSQGGGGGTQMYSSLRHAAPDDERLMEILGTAKFMNATVVAQPVATKEGKESPAADDAMVDIDELEREDEEDENGRPGPARLRERAERLERGRRLLARNGGPQPSKRPISFAGVAAISMGARF